MSEDTIPAVTLQIEHPVVDFDAWLQMFESDPADRKQSGVLSYRVLRPVDDPLYVVIELDFANRHTAEAFLSKVRTVWAGITGTLILDPRARIVELVDIHQF